MEGLVLRSFFLRKAELGFFHFLEIVTGWLVSSPGQKDGSAGWLVPSTAEDLALLKTGFFRQGKAAKNTNEKSTQYFA
jgi:hypothetical protein